MDNREENIFFNLIRNETTLTEAFCNLMQYKVFRDLFIAFVNNDNLKANAIKYDNFTTEKDFGFIENEEDKKLGRGDLVLNFDEQDYIFELKIEQFTKLTSNQPNSYFKYLEKNNPTNYKKRLYFIIPKNYKHINDLRKVEKTNILYWEDFLDKLKKHELNKINLFINDFYNIMQYRWFYFEKFHFSNTELNFITKGEKLDMESSTIPSIISKLMKIVDDVENHYKTKSYKDQYTYGFFIKDKDLKEVLWFGIDYELWKEERTPITLGIEAEDTEYYNKFKNIYSEKVLIYEYKDNKLLYSYISLNELIKNLNDTSEIKRLIDDVIDTVGLNN